MPFKAALLASFLVLPSGTWAQLARNAVYRTDFNSSFKFSDSQIQAARLDSALTTSLENNINFDRSQLAFGGSREDDFYTLPPLSNETSPLQPGQVLKVQAFTDQTAYSTPPNTALSRIIYTTTNFNGTVIPASAFILWPYTPRQFGSPLHSAHSNRGKSDVAKKAPVVVWAHGTSGFFAPQNPSSHRALWYDDSAPFPLAEAGYAVFAPDFAGLGIGNSWDGSEIPHQYHASPATAHDSLYGLRAALAAFPEKLSRDFVAMGHSQGGGVAWGIAEVLAEEKDEFADLLPGYKGAIAASPTTDVFGTPERSFIVAVVGQGLHSIFSSFDLSQWLTPLGVARVKLARDLELGVGPMIELLLSGEDILRSDWTETWFADAFSKLGNAGHKDFKGPLLVLQGTEDSYVPYSITTKTVEDSWRRHPDHDLEYVVSQGVGHVPDLRATKSIWLRWIDDRLAGKPLEKRGSVRTDLESLLPIEQYLSYDNTFQAWGGLPQYQYQVPLAV
ncbi:Alpha/Beta hydrolase protein [Lasiosphaeris hirsuta]|uniref:Alpha/Beta hydrolase protein n=1 Tax=Lasiosphaeris hirsuta TaxID=260670 RepID=A0AA39ZRL0_9PEZI|nr:Alpha/Beta hydrolase protein [Lasiosphaeris hirsuta]